MKFEVSSKEAEIHGDVKSNNVSIDKSNIDFIVTILSTNLYSKPIESFIRETVSNAWDSHVEAGNTDPVILELGKNTEGVYFCRIQDFGVGLSPERFDQIYRNIGSSTKRNDNTQIGGFGIGRFSALAYTDVVHITSNFEGMQYKYMMYKDGNSISIDLIYEHETDEKNGVQVQLDLKNRSDISNFYTAIRRQLVYFENLYFVDNTEANLIIKDEFNNFHIKKYDDFLVNTLDGNTKVIDLVLGKVRYPLRFDALNKSYPSYVREYPISLKFNIGDLQVTPNREEILYNQSNIDKIQDVLDRAISDIDKLYNEYSNKNYDDIKSYINAANNAHQAPLLTINDRDLVYIRIPKKELKITLKGVIYESDNFVRLYNNIMSYIHIPVAYKTDSYGKIIYDKSRYTNISQLVECFSYSYICDVSELNNISKSYIRENFQKYSLILSPDISVKKIYKGYLKKIYDVCNPKNTSYPSSNMKYDYKAIRVILDNVVKNLANIKKFSNVNVPKSYIDKKKDEEKAKRLLRKNAGINWAENINLFVLRESERTNLAVVANPVTYKLSDVKKKYQKLTIYDDKDSSKLRTLYNILSHVRSKADVLEIAPTRAKHIKDFQNFVKLEDFMNIKYKLIRQIATAKLIEEQVPYISKLEAILPSIKKVSTRLFDVVSQLALYNRTYIPVNSKTGKDERKLVDEICQLCKDNGYFDEEVKAVLELNSELLKQAEKILLFTEKGSYGQFIIPDDKINVLVDYILARKLFRPDIPAVFKLKQETVLNIKKDESN